jgi:hypothetical protein
VSNAPGHDRSPHDRWLSRCAAEEIAESSNTTFSSFDNIQEHGEKVGVPLAKGMGFVIILKPFHYSKEKKRVALCSLCLCG